MRLSAATSVASGDMPPPPSKPMSLHGAHSHLTWSPPSKKTTPPPPLKSEATFHEMIPRKSTINNNLKSG